MVKHSCDLKSRWRQHGTTRPVNCRQHLFSPKQHLCHFDRASAKKFDKILAEFRVGRYSFHAEIYPFRGGRGMVCIWTKAAKCRGAPMRGCRVAPKKIRPCHNFLDNQMSPNKIASTPFAVLQMG